MLYLGKTLHAAAPIFRINGIARFDLRQMAVAHRALDGTISLAHELVQGCYAGAAGLIFGWVLVTTGKLRYTILLHFAFNAGSYLMTLLWFVNTPLDVAVTVGIAGFVLVEAMRSLKLTCQLARSRQ